MLATIEACYDNGKITTTENIGIKSGKVLLTILGKQGSGIGNKPSVFGFAIEF